MTTRKHIVFFLGFMTFLTVFVAFSPRALSYGIGRYIMQVNKISVDGKQYAAVTIRTREDLGAMPMTLDSGEEGYILDLLNVVQKWILGQYVEQGRIIKGSELYEHLRTTETLVDERSTLIFLAEWNDLNKIKATMRVARAGVAPENRLFPFEKRLRAFADRLRRVLKPPETTVLDFQGTKVLSAEFAEWKNIVKAQGQEHDVIALLLEEALKQDLWGIAFRRIVHGGNLVRTVPAEIILECDSNMYDYYFTRFSFEPVLYIPEDDTHVMKVSRKMFLQRVREARRIRGGLLDRAQIEEVAFRPQLSPACDDILNFTRPFLRELGIKR
jgi:hypothetical protein